MNSAGWMESEENAAPGPSQVTLCCSACDTYQLVEVDYDSGQGCASLTVRSCSSCQQDLCPFCTQLWCECGQIVCQDCSVTVSDGTPSGLTLCKACAAEWEDDEREAAPELAALGQPAGGVAESRVA